MSPRRSASDVVYHSKRKHRLRLESLENRLMMAIDTISTAIDIAYEDPTAPAAEYASVLSGTSPDNSGPDLSHGPNEVGAAPTVVQPIRVNNSGSNITQAKRIQLSARGADDGGSRFLTYHWTLVDKPNGSNALFSRSGTSAARNTTLSFDRVGHYTVQLRISDRDGESITTTQSVTVTPQVKSFAAENNKAPIRNNAIIRSTSTNETIKIVAYDQFGKQMQVPGSAVWTTVQKPSRSTPNLSFDGNQLSVHFDRAGNYQFQFRSLEGRQFRVRFALPQQVTSIELQAPADRLELNEKVRLTVVGKDQFGSPITRISRPTFSVTAGRINSSGIYIAPKTATQVEVTAVVGTTTATKQLIVGNVQVEEQDPLESLMQSFFADGSIDRADMIALLRQAGADGVISTLELTQLRSLVDDAGNYHIPDDVRVLASNIVYSNLANAYYQTTTLGDLTPGSSDHHLEKLINKWFLGLDRPQLLQYTPAGPISYAMASGQLFNGTPSLYDQRQGLVGDCYLIASLGSVAMRNPDVIEDMFIDNGDGTYTVRFFANELSPASNGFLNGVGIADYVTVDLALPAFNQGRFFAYSNFSNQVTSPSNTLWIALAEKAYAQWNETGRAGQDGTNRYAGIEGGWMGTVYAQILGYNSTNYYVGSASSKATLIQQLANQYAVTIGTKSTSSSLVPGHAYTISGYDAASDRFTLHNPWGSNQPSRGLTWAEIQANCDWFSSINPFGTQPARSTNGIGQFIVQSQQFANDTSQTYFIRTDLQASTSNGNLLQSLQNKGAVQVVQLNSLGLNNDSHSMPVNTDPVESIDNRYREQVDAIDAIFADIDSLLNEALS